MTTALDDFRREFRLNPDQIHLAGLWMASHPRYVRDVIRWHAAGLDRSPFRYQRDNIIPGLSATQCAVAEYFDIEPRHVVETDSTSMGLGIVYSGFVLRPGDRILTTRHDFSGTREILAARTRRDGVAVDPDVLLFDDSASATAAQIVRRLVDAIAERTRLLALTWVHSNTGVKLPIADIAAAVADLNADRPVEQRVMVAVDGVHGFGIENVTFSELRCDFFVSGLHKWVFGPRGTGFACATSDAWAVVEPVLPPLTPTADRTGVSATLRLSPTGIHAFEHRWAVPAAIRRLLQIGKATIEARLHAVASTLKKRLSDMRRVHVVTPLPETLSSAIVCFDVEGAEPSAVVDKLFDCGVVATTSSFDGLTQGHHVRFSPSLINTDDEIDRALDRLDDVIARV